MVQSTVNPASTKQIEVNLGSVDDFRDSLSTIGSVFGTDAKIVFCENEGKVFAKKLSWPRWPRFHYCNDRVAGRLGDLLGDEGNKLADKMNSTFLCCFRIKNSLKVSEFGNAVANYNFQRFRGGDHGTVGTTNDRGLGETLSTSNESSSSFDARRRTDSESDETQCTNQTSNKHSTTGVNESDSDKNSSNHNGELSESLSVSGKITAKDTSDDGDSDDDKPLGVYVPDNTPLPKFDRILAVDNKNLSRREEYSNSVETLGKSLVERKGTPQQTVSFLGDAVEKRERVKENDSKFLESLQSDNGFRKCLINFGAENAESVRKQLSVEDQNEAPLPQLIRCVEGLRAYLPTENSRLSDASQILSSVNNSAVVAAGAMCEQGLEKVIDQLKNDTTNLVDQKKNQTPAGSIDELAERLQVNKDYLSAVIEELQIDWKA